MYYLNKDIELTTELLNKMLGHFMLNVQPKLKKYKNYYDGVQLILNKSYGDPSKPCSKAVINYCKNIVDNYCGYLATAGYISYSSEQDIDEIMNVLRYNDYQTEDSEFLRDALIYGTAAELMYMDGAGKCRFKLINPTQCFGIYDDSLTNDLRYFVRFYKANDWDNSDLHYVEVRSDKEMKTYKMSGANASCIFVKSEPLYFSQCPANILNLPDEKSIFDCVLGLQDSANELLNSEIDDYSAFCDAYLALIGVDATVEEIADMKKNRVMILPEGAGANYITKNVNDTQIENLRKSVHQAIYLISQCPDFSNESFTGGVSSGIAIRYKLSGMENKAGLIECEMKKALQRRIEIISGIASLKLGEEIFRDVQITFKRNVPADTAEIVNLVTSLKGIVSDSTLLGQLPFISDVNAELEKIKLERKANMALYNFGGSEEEEEDNEI